MVSAMDEELDLEEMDPEEALYEAYKLACMEIYKSIDILINGDQLPMDVYSGLFNNLEGLVDIAVKLDGVVNKIYIIPSED